MKKSNESDSNIKNNINGYSSYRMSKKNNNNINSSNANNDKQTKINSSSINSDINDNLIVNDIFSVKENKNNQEIKNYEKDKINEKKNEYISVFDLIGRKCNLNIDIIRYFYFNYEESKTSKKKMGLIKSYAVNTYQGIIRNYNEDRVSIIVNMNKPRGYYKKIWPRVSFFGIFDGHGGETCSEFLRDNLHNLIVHNNEFFPDNIPEAIKLAFNKAEKNFIENYALDKKKELKDKSGSCAVILLLVDNKIYIANVGDSRCLLSMENGKKYLEVTKDHKPNSPEEMKRIKEHGGKVYQTQTVIRKARNEKLIGKRIIGPFRVSPGGLSVSRTIGDVEAKLEKYGGNPNVVIANPDIFIYDLNKDDIDFFILGCDGIFDQLSSDEVINCAWMIYNNKDNNILVSQCKDIHKQSGLIVDLIMKSALFRKSFDNVTCLFISFKEIWNSISSENNKSDNDSKIILSSLNSRATNENENNIKRTRNYDLLKENINNNRINTNEKNKTQYNIRTKDINENKIELNKDNINNNKINNICNNSLNYNYKNLNNNINNEKNSIRRKYLSNKGNSKLNEIKNTEPENNTK